MFQLNVLCKCGKGKLNVSSTRDDYYDVSCKVCHNVYEVHYTGLDCLIEESEYNDQANDDIVVLNNNGEWHGHKYNLKDSELELELEGFKEIYSIESYEEMTFYQKGSSFLQVVYNPVHKTKSLYKFVAREDGMSNLIAHFFSK